MFEVGMFVDGRTAACFHPSLTTSVETVEVHLKFVQKTLENAAAREAATEHEVR
jgi:hypothetical protein